MRAYQVWFQQHNLVRRLVKQIIRPTVGLGCCLFYDYDTVVVRSWVVVAPVLCGGFEFSLDFVM